MYRRLLKDASLYSVSSLVARGFSLITVPIYTRILSPADYGALDLLSYLAVLVPLFVGAALDQAIARFYHDAKDDLERKRFASSALFYTVFVFVLFIPFVKPLAGMLAHEWLHDQVGEATVILVFILIWMNAIFTIANNLLIYLFLSKRFAICSIGNTTLSIGLGFTFVVYFKWGVFGILLGQALSVGAFILLSLYFGSESYGLIFDRKSLGRMLAYSLPLVPGTLAFYAMQYVDRYAINQLNGLHDVGLYGIGARIASLVNLFLMGFQGAWSPTVMKNFRDNDAPKKFQVVFNYYFFVVTVILIGLSLFGREILLLLTTKTFSQGFVVVPLLTLAAILASIGQYFTYGIQIAKKSNYRLYLNFAALTLNVVLNYVLIPPLGIIGAALATVISLTSMTVTGIWLSQQYYHVPYRWANIITAAALAIVVSNSVILVDNHVTPEVIATKIAAAFISIIALSRLLNIPLNAAAARQIWLRFGSQPK